MKCRILYLVGQLATGGLERQLYFLLQGMDRARYRPAVVVWNFHDDDVYVPKIRSINVPIHSFSEVSSRVGKLRALRCLVRSMKPEVVHSYSFYTNFAGWYSTLGTRAVAMGSARSNFHLDMTESGPLLGRLSASWPRIQIYNNFAGADTARNSRRLFTPRQVFVVRNGVDLERFRKIPLPSNGRVRIVGVGSLLQVKRWDRLLKVALELKKSNFDFLLEIAGAGPLRQSLEQQARSLGVANRVNFIGNINTDDVPALLAKSTLLAHTSDIEGCPNAVMEAMACGRAVVATAVGDIPSLVEDGKTGFVVPPGDDEQFVERLATLITDRGLCRQMGEASRVKAEREFGLYRLVEETLNAYREAGWKGL